MEAYLCEENDVDRTHASAPWGESELPIPNATISGSKERPAHIEIEPIHPRFPQYTKLFAENPGFEGVVNFVSSELDATYDAGAEEEKLVRTVRDKIELEYFKSVTILKELEGIEAYRGTAVSGTLLKAVKDQIYYNQSKQLLQFNANPPSERNHPKSRTLQPIETNALNSTVENILGIRQLQKPTGNGLQNFHDLIPLIERKLSRDESKTRKFVEIFRKKLQQNRRTKIEKKVSSVPNVSQDYEAAISSQGNSDSNFTDLSEYLGTKSMRSKPKRQIKKKKKSKSPVKNKPSEPRKLEKQDTKQASSSESSEPLKCSDETTLDLEQTLTQTMVKKLNISQEVQGLRKEYASTFLKLFNCVNKALQSSATLAEKFYIGQIKGIKLEIDHRLLRKQCLQAKLKALDFEFIGRTYKREKVVALKEIRRHINTRLQSIQNEVSKLRKEVSSYDSLDIGFREYVNQYADLQQKIKSVEYHLKQFEE